MYSIQTNMPRTVSACLMQYCKSTFEYSIIPWAGYVHRLHVTRYVEAQHNNSRDPRPPPLAPHPQLTGLTCMACKTQQVPRLSAVLASLNVAKFFLQQRLSIMAHRVAANTLHDVLPGRKKASEVLRGQVKMCIVWLPRSRWSLKKRVLGRQIREDNSRHGCVVVLIVARQRSMFYRVSAAQGVTGHSTWHILAVQTNVSSYLRHSVL